MKTFFKEKKYKSKKHLKLVASKPCMICGSCEVQAHHLMRAEATKGMGLKTGDDKTVPLCIHHHTELHSNGDEIGFFIIYGWDYSDVKQLARELWQCSM